MNKVLSGVLCTYLSVGMVTGVAYAGEWYQGGTLHQATVAEWRAATDANRLATAGDWTGKMVGADTLQRLGGMDAARRMAGEMVTCLNTGTVDSPANSDIASAAVMCAILMKWPMKSN